MRRWAPALIMDNDQVRVKGRTYRLVESPRGYWEAYFRGDLVAREEVATDMVRGFTIAQWQQLMREARDRIIGKLRIFP